MFKTVTILFKDGTQIIAYMDRGEVKRYVARDAVRAAKRDWADVADYW